MNKLTRVKLALTTLSVALLSSCSSNLYTFAPQTSAYHETTKRTVKSEEKAPVADTKTSMAVAATNVSPAEIPANHTEAATALAQAYSTKKTVVSENNVTSETGKSNVKKSIKKVRQEVQKIKQKVKESKGLGLSSNVKLLLILGLAFILVGALLNVGIIYTIGAILLIIALVLLLMEIL
jgi:cobalamin biosynthesis Mg chelatase CobN